MFDKKKKFVLIGLVVIIFAFIFIPINYVFAGISLSQVNANDVTSIRNYAANSGSVGYNILASPLFSATVGRIFGEDSDRLQFINAFENIRGLQQQIDFIDQSNLHQDKKDNLIKAAFSAHSSNVVEESKKASDDLAPNNTLIYLQNVLGWLLYLVFAALGWIITQLVWVMLTVMTYPIDINNTSAVVTGWKVVRDLCNNFFIVLLIVVAIGTIIGKKEYSIKSLLPKILLAAILVNFSKLFVGLVIDLSQIIMLTFASAFANIRGGNIVLAAIGLPDLANIAKSTDFDANGAGSMARTPGSDGKEIGFVNILAALIYAIIIAIILIVVISVIVAILVIRIVALLFLTVLSPLYFFGSSFSLIGKHTDKWMERFGKYVVVGPTLLFFLWLSIMMMGVQTDKSELRRGSIEGLDLPVDDFRNADKPIADSTNDDIQILSQAMSIEGMINTALVIGMLCFTLVMAQQSGVAGQKLGGQALGFLQKQAKRPMGWGKSLGKTAKGLGKSLGKTAIGKAGTLSLGLASVASKKAGDKWGSEGLQKLGDFGSQWRSDVLKKRRDARRDKLGKIMGKVGLGSDEAKEKWGAFTDTKMAKNAKSLALSAGSIGAMTATGIATGGAGLLPNLAVAAAGYFGGGGRLLEMMLGKESEIRAKDREEKSKKIDDARKDTERIISISEKGRDLAVETEEKLDPTYAAKEKAEKDLEKFESTKRDGKGKVNPGDTLSDFYNFLRSKGYMGKDNKISKDVLDKAKEEFRKETAFTDRKGDISAHEVALKTIKEDEERKHRGRVETELNASKTGKTEAEKEIIDAEIDVFKEGIKLKDSLQKLKDNLETELEKINATKYSPDIAINEIRKEQERNKAKKDNDDKVSAENIKYTEKLEEVQPVKPQPGKMDKFLDDYKPYAHENWVSQAVAKDAKKMQETIKNLISSIENAGSDALSGFDVMSRGSMYSQNGQTEQQFKSFKAMLDSTKAMKALTDSLASIKTNEVFGDQARLIRELKQGLAAFEKGGGDITKFSPIINLINQKVGMNNENERKIIDNKSVADYKDSVTPKK